jgi:chromosome segregation ATPase
MKTFGYISLTFLLALSLLTGCESTRSITSSITGSSNEDLLAQVPAEAQGEIRQAEFDLQVAEEKVNLAKLKAELASLQKKYADYDEDVTNEYRKEAEVGLDLANLEAIDRSGLGEKEDNINKIADLKSKKLKIEANRIKIEAKRETTERKIKDLNKQMEEQETKIINLEASGVLEPEKTEDTQTGEEQPEKKSNDM